MPLVQVRILPSRFFGNTSLSLELINLLLSKREERGEGTIRYSRGLTKRVRHRKGKSRLYQLNSDRHMLDSYIPHPVPAVPWEYVIPTSFDHTHPFDVSTGASLSIPLDFPLEEDFVFGFSGLLSWWFGSWTVTPEEMCVFDHGALGSHTFTPIVTIASHHLVPLGD
jgi:hypothetical protein